MTHRRYRRKRTAAEKAFISGAFQGPRWCDRCREKRPREGGQLVTAKNGRIEWHCGKHAEAGDGH